MFPGSAAFFLQVVSWW